MLEKVSLVTSVVVIIYNNDLIELKKYRNEYEEMLTIINSRCLMLLFVILYTLNSSKDKNSTFPI